MGSESSTLGMLMGWRALQVFTNSASLASRAGKPAELYNSRGSHRSSLHQSPDFGQRLGLSRGQPKWMNFGRRRMRCMSKAIALSSILIPRGVRRATIALRELCHALCGRRWVLDGRKFQTM